ncbi:hypothetical protein FLSI110296_00965 [Flavobacterium sinopsychrotolerans]
MKFLDVQDVCFIIVIPYSNLKKDKEAYSSLHPFTVLA